MHRLPHAFGGIRAVSFSGSPDSRSSRTGLEIASEESKPALGDQAHSGIPPYHRHERPRTSREGKSAPGEWRSIFKGCEGVVIRDRSDGRVHGSETALGAGSHSGDYCSEAYLW